MGKTFKDKRKFYDDYDFEKKVKTEKQKRKQDKKSEKQIIEEMVEKGYYGI